MPWQHIWVAKLYVWRGRYPVVKAWGRTAQPAAAAEEGKGWALLLLSQAYSWIFPTSYKHLPTPLSAPSSCQGWNPQPKGKGSVAGCKPSLFPSQIPTLSRKQKSASAPAPPLTGGLLSTHRSVGRSSAGWRLPEAWPSVPGADSLARAALPNTRDPEGYL